MKQTIKFTGRFIAPNMVLFGLCVNAYFLDFIRIGFANNTHCGFSGFDFIFGRTRTDCFGLSLVIASDLWAILTFVLAAAGFIYSLFYWHSSKGHVFLFALSAIVCLIFFQIKMQQTFEKIEKSGILTLSWGYWLLLIAFGTLGLWDYALRNRVPIKENHPKEQKTQLNINIITQIRPAEHYNKKES